MSQTNQNRAPAAAAKPNGNDQTQPLLSPQSSVTFSLIEGSLYQVFKSTANLAKLLPTGTVLTFQLLAPIFTNKGSCDVVYRHLTIGLLCAFALSCALLSFTDSFKDDHGVIRYVFATFKGVWVIDGSPPPQRTTSYRLKFIDFVHAFMSVLVFGSIAFLDQNIVSCLYPEASTEVQEILKTLPMSIGVLSSMLFVSFPTVRHGIGFPVAPHQ